MSMTVEDYYRLMPIYGQFWEIDRHITPPEVYKAQIENPPDQRAVPVYKNDSFQILGLTIEQVGTAFTNLFRVMGGASPVKGPPNNSGTTLVGFADTTVTRPGETPVVTTTPKVDTRFYDPLTDTIKTVNTSGQTRVLQTKAASAVSGQSWDVGMILVLAVVAWMVMK